MTDRNDIENDDIENNTLDALSRLVLQLEADARALAQTAATAQGREQQQGQEQQEKEEEEAAVQEIQEINSEEDSSEDLSSSYQDEFSDESSSDQVDQKDLPTRTHYSFKNKGMRESIQQRPRSIHREGKEAKNVSWFVLTILLAWFCGKFI
jgi:ribosomal protein L12E/L44/L45/RPP1/RPP2